MGIPRQLLNVLQGSQRKDAIPGEGAGQPQRGVASVAVTQDSAVLPGGLGTYRPHVSVCARGSSLSPPEARMTDGVYKGGCHMDRNVAGAEVCTRGSSSLPNTHLIK